MATEEEQWSESEDLGEPVKELQELTKDPAPGFSARIVRRVERRNLAGQAVDLSWAGVVEVFKELLAAVVGLGSHQSEEKDDE